MVCITSGKSNATFKIVGGHFIEIVKWMERWEGEKHLKVYWISYYDKTSIIKKHYPSRSIQWYWEKSLKVIEAGHILYLKISEQL